MLQIYAYVYQKMMDFQRGRFDHQKLTTNGFFETIHKIFHVKIHPHYSHVTGKIIKIIMD